MRGTIKVEWNSKAVIDLIQQMANEEEESSARRVFAYAVRDVPVGHITRYQTPRSRHWKWFYKRKPGSLLESIRKVASRFQGGGKIVFAGEDDKLTYYAHFVEFGTVFMKRRRGYRFMRKSILREKRAFVKRIEANLAGDMPNGS